MLYDSEAMRRLAQVELPDDRMQDESTIFRFRDLLEQNQLTSQSFDAVSTLLEDQRLPLKAGTTVDATIIAAPSPPKNPTRTRDPEIKQTRNGNQWNLGIKPDVGTDRQGVVH